MPGWTASLWEPFRALAEATHAAVAVYAALMAVTVTAGTAAFGALWLLDRP